MLKTIARAVLVFAGLILVGSWIIVILVDGFNIMSLGDRIIEQSNRDASAFVVLFSEGRPVEWAQWFCLMTSCVIAAYVGASENLVGNTNRYSFFILMSFLFAIMVMEDAGNISLRMRSLYESFGLDPNIGRYVRMGWYGLIGLIPTMAIVLYGRRFMEINSMWSIFVIGFIFYFVAASASAGVWGSYVSAGDTLNNMLFQGRVVYESPIAGAGHWIMDYLVEETLELIGAISFLYFTFWYYLVECLQDNPKGSHSSIGA